MLLEDYFPTKINTVVGFWGHCTDFFGTLIKLILEKGDGETTGTHLTELSLSVNRGHA